MSLSLALNNALSGLNINQQSLAVLSQNIANANTVGYSQKILKQQAVYLDGRGAGVSMQDISRRVDEYLTRSIRLQTGGLGKAATMGDYLDRTQLLLGNPGAGNSFDAYITNFFNSIQALAHTPENRTLAVGMINSGKNFASQAGQLSNALQDMRMEADRDINIAITAINKDIRDLRQLNISIAQDLSLGKSVAELLDRRDTILRDLSQYLDVQTYNRGNGAINIVTAGGATLLDEEAYQLSYQSAGSLDTFIQNTDLAPVLIHRINDEGTVVGQPTTLITGGKSSQIATPLTTGKLKGLLEMRDRQIPAMLAQLDTLVSGMREQFNRVHNAGIAYPGARSYTGTHQVFGSDVSMWSGKMRLAVLGANGQPIDSPYADETSGVRPLTIDFANLNTGAGKGNVSVQGVINEINQYYGAQGNRTTLGSLNNIRLASNSASLPGVPPRFDFDFDLENISGGNANFFVTGVEVLDDTNAPMTISQDVPRINMAATNTYVMDGTTNVVTVNTTLPPGVSVGDTVYISPPPAGTYNGIDAADLGGFVTVTSVSGNSFQFEAATASTGTAQVDLPNLTMTPRYAEVETGTYGRTTDSGTIQANLAANPTSDFYTVRVNVAVENEDGTISTSQVIYRVENGQTNMLNSRYSATAATDDATLVAPANTQAIARAILVDANGRELPKTNGQYVTTEGGYLKIIAANSDNVIALDSMDSLELGNSLTNPPTAATNRGFSHFFGLNNFFTERDGQDPLINSALNLQIEQRLIDNPNLISLGRLVQSDAPTDPNLPPLYTYIRTAGDNSMIQALSLLGDSRFNFASAGGLGASTQTFAGYAASFIGVASNNASLAENEAENSELLMNGYMQRNDSISGVNLDEELANTVIYQNAYTASARVITVTNTLYDALLNSFQ